MNTQQKAYTLAVAHFAAVKAEQNAAESAYCKEHNLTNKHGHPVRFIWMLDDETMFEQANADFCALHPEFEQEYNTAHAALYSAENALIEYGLSLMPEIYKEKRETLRKAANERITARMELIKHIMSLNTSTVPAQIY
jgi:hypothetical protein